MNLMDRAARALAAGLGDDWYALDTAAQTRLRDSVHAVLKALRQPDMRMTEAGAEIIRNVGPEESDAAYLSDAANTWCFMIDALLGED